MDTNMANTSVSVWWCLYVLSNTQATFEAQFIRKLSNTEAELKRTVAYKKKRVNHLVCLRQQENCENRFTYLHIIFLKYALGSSIKYVRKIFRKITFLTSWYAPVRVRIRGVEMLVFRKNFAYVLNRRPLSG